MKSWCSAEAAADAVEAAAEAEAVQVNAGVGPANRDAKRGCSFKAGGSQDEGRSGLLNALCWLKGPQEQQGPSPAPQRSGSAGECRGCAG